jgi:hypothetical protein
MEQVVHFVSVKRGSTEGSLCWCVATITWQERIWIRHACLLLGARGFSDYKCSRLSASLKDRCSLLEFCPSSKRAGPSAAHRDALVCWGMTRPLISILTPVLNRIDLLGGALDSVRRARGVPSEHLVIDGGSTDGTLSLLRSRPGIRLIEAPGTGIYDALNLGLRAACGDIICQLNSDDLLPAGALEAVAEADAGAGRGADAVRGRAVFFADDAAQNASAATLSAEFPVPLRPRDVALGAPAINALFVRRRLYDRVGYFDPRFRLAADREWLLRAFAAGMRVHEICAVGIPGYPTRAPRDLSPRIRLARRAGHAAAALSTLVCERSGPAPLPCRGRPI